MAAKVPCLAKKIDSGKFYDLLRVRRGMQGGKSFLGHVHFHVSAPCFKIRRFIRFPYVLESVWDVFLARGTLSHLLL